VSGLPFDPASDAAVEEGLRMSSLDGLGRECARRCAMATDVAEASWHRARNETVDLVTAATAAQLATDAAAWASRLAAATTSLLGNADVAAVKLAWSQAHEAQQHATNAAASWERLRDARGCHVA